MIRRAAAEPVRYLLIDIRQIETISLAGQTELDDCMLCTVELGDRIWQVDNREIGFDRTDTVSGTTFRVEFLAQMSCLQANRRLVWPIKRNLTQSTSTLSGWCQHLDLRDYPRRPECGNRSAPAYSHGPANVNKNASQPFLPSL